MTSRPEHDEGPDDGSLAAAVARFAVEHPEMGQAKVAEALRAQGIGVSASGVRYLWRKRGLETRFKRLKAIEESGAAANGLTDAQRAILRRGDARRRLARKTGDADAAASRMLILNAAAELFSEQGYAGASMRDIAVRAGLLAGSVYHHYPAKEDLYVAVQEEGLRQIVEHVEDAIRASADPWTRLELACAEHLANLVAGNAIARVTVTGLFAIHERGLQRRLSRPRDRYEAIFRRLIGALGLPRGSPRTLIRMALLGALNWTLVWYRPGGMPPREIARRIVALVRGGAGAG